MSKSDDGLYKSNHINHLEGRVAWDISLLQDRATSIAQHRGRAAYDAYALDVFRAGDRHVRTAPIGVSDLSDGYWWARDSRDGQLVVLRVQPTAFGGEPYVTMSGDETCLTTGNGALKFYEFICKIQEPA